MGSIASGYRDGRSMEILRLSCSHSSEVQHYDCTVGQRRRLSGPCEPVWRDQTAIDIYMSAFAGEANALPDSTTDPNAITQFTSADLFVRVGQNVTSQSLPYILPSNVTLVSISSANNSTLTRGVDYSISHGAVVFSAHLLRRYFTPSTSPGPVVNLTIGFSSGADLTLALVLWDTPMLNSTSSSVAAANDASVSIPVQWKGINKPAAVKAVTANGTYLVDDFTKYYGPLQNARTVSYDTIKSSTLLTYTHTRTILSGIGIRTI
jgi:endoglucanase